MENDMNKFRVEGNKLYHKCESPEFKDGICEFETDSFGDTWFVCRACKKKFGLPELTREVAEYYTTPAY